MKTRVGKQDRAQPTREHSGPATYEGRLDPAQAKAFGAASQRVLVLQNALAEARTAQALALRMLGIDPARVVGYDMDT